jgi:hypothetical protein
MKKTSVYLTEEEATSLRRLAVREGRPQAELIREGVQRVINDAGEKPREFRSLGKGRGGGRPFTPWDADALYKRRVATK